MWSTFRKKTIAAAPKHTKHDKEDESDGLLDLVHDKSHHAGGGRYINPWPSATTPPSKSWIPSCQIPLTWAGKPHPELRSGWYSQDVYILKVIV